MNTTLTRIVVTSATSLVGRMLLPKLRAAGYHVTALTRTAVDVPADELITDWVASAAAMDALESADVIIHLSGEIQAKTWAEYYQANVQTTEKVTQALRRGRARRAIFISYPNADTASTNLFLRAKGMAEALLRNSGKDTVIFRVQAIINTPAEPGPAEQALIAPLGKPVQTLGNGLQAMYTIYRPDVVTALMQAIVHGRAGSYDLIGPDMLTMDELIRLLNRNEHMAIRHTPEWLARLLSWFVPDLPPSFVDLYFQKYHMDGTQAVQEFHLALTSLRAIWK